MTDTPKITEAEIARLRELAETANVQTTGNRWLPDVGGIVLDPDRPGDGWDGTIVCEVPPTERPERRRAIRDYLVELDPQTVIALLDAVEARTEPPVVTDEMVEAAARAMFEETYGIGDWVYREVLEERVYRRRARTAVEAALAVSPKKGQD